MEESFDLDTVDRLLGTTRSVRRRLDLTRPVPRSVVLECIALSQQAPNAESREQWRWVVVDDVEQRRRIAEVYGRGTESLRDLEAGADGRARRMYESVVWLAERMAEVPVLVFPCLCVRPPAEFASWYHGTLYASILPAIWSFQLALRSRGLGSTLTTLHLRWEDEIAEMLGIPDHALQVAMLPVAYTVGMDFKPAERRPTEEIVSYDGWRFPDDGPRDEAMTVIDADATGTAEAPRSRTRP